MKKVSVIINCKNGEKYLTHCVESVLSQTYINFEIIFFDNCSQDKTRNLIKNFKDKRIKYFFSKKSLSLYKARNKAIKKATGQLVAFLDIDDWWDKNYLQSRLKVFENKKFDYFYSNVNLHYQIRNKNIAYRNKNLPKGKIYKYLAQDYFIIISGLIVRKKLFYKEGFFNSKLNIIGDYDFVMRISQIYFAHAINKPLVFYRVHEKNYSRINSKLFYSEYKNWYEFQKKKK